MLRTRIPSRIVVPAVVLTVAAGLRLWGLGAPPTLYWDEQYYVFDAEVYLGGGIGQPIPGAPAVKIADEGTWVHPPLGKWVIALLGAGPLGDRPIGWRFPSALFGIAGVALLYLLALQLWRSVWWAGFASLLLALDGLHIVQSRIAMLDIFLSTFVIAGILLLVLDRRRMAEADDGSGSMSRVDRVFGSWYRLGAGASLGAAVATKWSGAFALVFATIVCCAWLARDDRRDGRRLPVRLATVAASFVMVPAAVYLLSYGAFFYQHGFAIRDFLTLQLRMLRYQQTHERVQPENSAPWTWPLLLHPIQYFRILHGGSTSTIVALGNPALWWGFLVLLPFAAVRLWARRHWQDTVAFGGYLVLYLPWFLVGRSQFLFYALPAVPFMCLCVVATIREMQPTAARRVAFVLGSLVVVAATCFMPVWTGWWAPTSWVARLSWWSTG